MQNSTPQEVPVDKLRWRCDLSCIPYKTTNDISFKEQILGQERALKAIQMGLDIESPGYNIFVTGIAGTGRTTSVRRLLAKKKKKEDIPDDKCYVNNFRNPDSPRVISLPAGKGRAFKKDMFHLISYISKQIPVIFESDLYVKKRSEIIEKYNQKEQTIVRQFERKMNKEGFSLVQVQLGPVTKPDLLPIVDGKPVPFEQLNALVQEGKMEKAAFESLRDKYLQLIKEMPEMLKEVRKNQRAFRDDLLGLDAQFARDLIDPLIADIKEKFSSEHVDLYLDEVNEHILDTLDLFREKPEEENTTGKSKSANSAAFHDYQVNIVVDNADLKGAPVIFETTPTYKNLFGSIERIMDRNGQWRTDFTKIKAGSFLRASGGYLIINALDALLEQGVWQNLKRSLKNQCVVIQSIDPYFMVATSALKPQPIRTEVKVIMIGDPQIYQLLYYQDDDFKKIFKIRADFDNVMEKAQPSIEQYANFIKMICDDEKLSPFDTSAIAGVIEFGVKLAGRQNKISTRFNHIADLVREANYWAAQSAKKTVTGAHVDKALEAKIDRVSLIEDKIRELIQDGTIMIDTSGAEVGQVNGLSVIDLGDYAFGHPSRITAQTAMGRRDRSFRSPVRC